MATYIKIATVTVGAGGSATISFTSIPNTYTDLLLRVSLRTNRAATSNDAAYITFNSSGGTAYSTRLINGDGTSATSLSDSAAARIYNYRSATATTATASTFSNVDIYVPNYLVSANKSVSVDYANETNATAQSIGLLAGLWANTAAITTITLTPEAGNNYVQHSTATLYGIKKS